MKAQLVIFSAVCIFLLTSCQPKSVTVKNVSPNQKVSIVVAANRSASLDPWKVNLSVKAYEFRQGQLAFELQGGDVNDKTVKFDWKDDKTCIISFDEPDGKPRTFQLIADTNQVQLAEINL